jgi:serine phosphatase RsbU (regulator of sigma subunit)
MTQPRRTLTQRLYLLVGGVAAVLLVVIVAVVAAAIAFRDDANHRERLLPASADAVELSGLLAEQLHVVTSEGTDSSDVDQELVNGRQRIDVLVGRLEGVLSPERELADRLERLRADLLVWKRSQPAGASDDPVAREAATERLRPVVEAADELSLAITDEIAAVAAVAQASRTEFLRAVSAAIALALALLVVGTVALRRLVIVPVRRLSHDVAEVAEGAFDHEIRGSGSRELAELAQAVTRMRHRILSERDQARRAMDAADQEAPAVAALRTLLAPRESPCPPELDVAGALVPADGALAGDWFDIAASPDKVVLAIGDVCGHGVDAGLLAVRTKFALLDAIDLGLDPAAALELASSRFGRDDTFATALVAEIDLRSGTCRYASAGHTPMLLLRANGTVEQLSRTGPLIGLAQGARPNATVQLEAGDTLVLYTDGVVEARPRGGLQLLEEGLLEVVRSAGRQSATALTELILAAVVSHCEGICPDDATIAVVRVNQIGVLQRVG